MKKIATEENCEQTSEIYQLYAAIENELSLLRGPDGLCLLFYVDGTTESSVASILARRLYLYHHVNITAPACKLPLAG